jgi:hypothetical protein
VGRAIVTSVVGLGLLLIPITVLITAVQWLLVSGIDAISSVTGSLAGSLAYIGLVVGTTLKLLGLGLVPAATACALVELDAGREVGPVDAYRLALRRIRPLLRAIAIFVAVLVVLTTTVLGLPVAAWLAVRWSLLAPVVELEDRRPYEALRRSGELVRGRWLRVGSLVGVAAWLVFNNADATANPQGEQLNAPLSSAPPVVAASLMPAFAEIEKLTGVGDSVPGAAAMQKLDSISPMAQSDSDKVHVALLKAESHFAMQQLTPGCAILKDNEGKANRTGVVRFAQRIDLLLQACP